MQMTTAGELQAKFKAGLQLVGEDIDGDLEWMGTKEEFRKSEEYSREVNANDGPSF